MTDKIFKLFKINNLQYNARRDPQPYRRFAGEPFRIQAIIDGHEITRITLTDEKGKILAQRDLCGPATFSHELTFAGPGVRIVTLSASQSGRNESHDLRLDAMAPQHE